MWVTEVKHVKTFALCCHSTTGLSSLLLFLIWLHQAHLRASSQFLCQWYNSPKSNIYGCIFGVINECLEVNQQRFSFEKSFRKWKDSVSINLSNCSFFSPRDLKIVLTSPMLHILPEELNIVYTKVLYFSNSKFQWLLTNLLFSTSYYHWFSHS